MYRDLDSAVAGLPLASAMAASEYGRITKNAAWALKSRMGLTEGTRNKYHHLGDAQKHLNQALSATGRTDEPQLA